MEIRGKISAVLEAKSGVSAKTGKEWKSQDFVIEFSNGQYINHFALSMFGDEKLKNYADLLVVGKDVVVSFDVDAHEYNGRWFNSINAWKIEDANAVSTTGNGVAAPAYAQPAAPAPQPMPQQPANIPAPAQDSGEDLPF